MGLFVISRVLSAVIATVVCAVAFQTQVDSAESQDAVNSAQKSKVLYPFVGEDVSSRMFPFRPSRTAEGNIIDVSSWGGTAICPAGEDGFISVCGDHFVDEAGKEIRFIGTSIGMTGCFPEHGDAEILARELKRYGINIVRLHYVSHRTPEDGYPVKDSFIEPVQMERFDYLFAKLKEQGIYTYFQLNIARKFGRVNGVEKAHLLPYYKNGIDQVDSLMISLQKRFHKEILTHINPYTGLTYKDDPAVAMMELANENSIVNAWYAPKYDFPNIVEPYRTRLMDKWNEWLEDKYGGLDEADNSPFSRRRDWAVFLYDIESDYFSELSHNVKEVIGARQREEMAAQPAIKTVFSAWGGWQWLYQRRQNGTSGLVSERVAYAPITSCIWKMMKYGDRKGRLTEAYAMYRLLIDQRFLAYDSLRGYSLHYLVRLGLFGNTLSRVYADKPDAAGGTYTRENKPKWVMEDLNLTDSQIEELDRCYDDMMRFVRRNR